MVIEQIKASKLRGRGGAGFPTGLKWEFLRKAEAEQKYIICNADEGDPGAYMNRNEIESDPHSLLEGMIIGGLRHRRHRGHHLRARRISAGRPSPANAPSSRPANTACWATTSWAAASTSISNWWKARARSSAAKRRR